MTVAAAGDDRPEGGRHVTADSELRVDPSGAANARRGRDVWLDGSRA